MLERRGATADTAGVSDAVDTEVPDVLADRYASRAMVEIWSPRAKILLEREFWIAVMRAQRTLGLDIPARRSRRTSGSRRSIDLDSIRARERVTRHDVKARIDEFCALAGHEHIHKGLTSRDLTENVEQLQVLRSLRLLRVKYVACLRRLARRVEEYRALRASPGARTTCRRRRPPSASGWRCSARKCSARCGGSRISSRAIRCAG